MKQGSKIKDMELYTIGEVLAKLKISRQTLWRLTEEKKIKTVRIGNSVRYTSAGVAQLLDS